MDRKVKIKLSGVNTKQDVYDGRMKCNYLYIFNLDSSSSENSKYNVEEKKDYEFFIEDSDFTQQQPILLNYLKDNHYSVSAENGVYVITQGGNKYSFYRREYNVYRKLKGFKIISSGERVPEYEEYSYIGQWEPVGVKVDKGKLRDFNVTNNRYYQYIIYPLDSNTKQGFANSNIEEENSKFFGEPVYTCWNEWSLTELIPQEDTIKAPVSKKIYKADLDNVWLFKYNLEAGEQTQNFSRSEIQTLGQYNRIANSKLNSISGNVSCLLGNEIIPYSKEGYIERLTSAIQKPLSTNERVKMLQQWRKLVSSKNPKLLKDMKGQSWIVQIFSSSNTPKNSVRNQPDTISFSWKEIDSTEKLVIYGEGDTIVRNGGIESQWKPTLSSTKTTKTYEDLLSQQS